MRCFLALLCLFCCGFLAEAQDGFLAKPEKNKVKLPFQLINNLVIVPISVNGVELQFLLDTGVEETILFSLEDKEVRLYGLEKLKLRGLGNQEAIEGLRSRNNTLSFGGLSYTDQEIYVVIDEKMNLASSLGVPVNGIIGYHLFADNLVKVDYAARKVIFYNPAKAKTEKLTRGYTSFEISIERNKPYLEAKVNAGKAEIPAKLLLDTGNSDAIWLFDQESDQIDIPQKNFDDFLGRGFSGPIFGKKARIADFAMQQFRFRNPVVSFPDTTSLRNLKMVQNRLGSIGGEVFKRFSVIFDYAHQKCYFKKNGNFDLPFHCNTSGIELHHAGMQLVKEISNNTGAASAVKIDLGSGNPMDVKYKFELKPVYQIASVRKGSPADLAGIREGDVLLSVNRRQSYSYTLQEINEFLKADDGRKLLLEIGRGGAVLKFQLEMKSLL